MQEERRKRKRKLGESDVGGARGGGRGIHRKQPGKKDFDYGYEYRAKVRGRHWSSLLPITGGVSVCSLYIESPWRCEGQRST